MSKTLKSRYSKAGVVLATSAPVLAHAAGTDPGADIFGAISFSTIAASVVAVAIVSMGISTAFKAWGLGKKAVNRV